MKKNETRLGMRVFRIKANISFKTQYNRGWNYGIVVSEPYGVPNGYRELWKVDVEFDNGEIAPVPLNMLKEKKE